MVPAAVAEAVGDDPAAATAPPGEGFDWPALAPQLPVVALARSLALQSEWGGAEGERWTLRVPSEQFARAAAVDKLQAALREQLGRPIELRIEIGQVRDSAHLRASAARAQRQRDAEASIATDPLVRELVDEHGAQIVPGSIRPLEA